jgi:sterol desaturase/sphingolipid hydroxylase (fatty acid hydroxylase superfamily)
VSWSLPTFDAIGGPVLAALLLVWLGLETTRPLRLVTQPRTARLRTNAAMAATAFATTRLVVLPVALATSAAVSAWGWGLLAWLGAPLIVAAPLAFVSLDYTTYAWHRLNHRVPFLWRFHGVHHTDLDLDVTTSFRFHFGEVLLSTGFRVAQVAVLGLSPALFVAYEIVMDAATEFHHSNVRLPLALERALSLVLVTPRMHGIHHSIVERETNANWSVILPWWDRLHGTLRLDVPQADIVVGVPAYRVPEEVSFGRLLAMPFRRQRPMWRLSTGEHPDRLPSAGRQELAA